MMADASRFGIRRRVPQHTVRRCLYVLGGQVIKAWLARRDGPGRTGSSRRSTSAHFSRMLFNGSSVRGPWQSARRTSSSMWRPAAISRSPPVVNRPHRRKLEMCAISTGRVDRRRRTTRPGQTAPDVHMSGPGSPRRSPSVSVGRFDLGSCDPVSDGGRRTGNLHVTGIRAASRA